MNQLFEKLLRDYQIDERFKEPLKDQLLLTYQSLTSTDKEIVRALKQNLRDVELKLEKIEERFALGEIDRPVYDKIGGKIKEEKKIIEAQLEVPKNKLSAHLIHSKKVLKICSNLSDFLVSADYDSKIRLQEILFPQGILYDKEIANYRTTSVNVVIELTRLLSNNSGEEKSGSSKKFFDLSGSVPKEGPDNYRDKPSHLKIHDFVPIAPDGYRDVPPLRHISLSV